VKRKARRTKRPDSPVYFCEAPALPELFYCLSQSVRLIHGIALPGLPGQFLPTETTKVFVDKYDNLRNNASMLKKNPALPKPTDAELAILAVLWRKGACTVREVWEELARLQETGYTTVLKTMQIMLQKGLLSRNEQERSHVYAAMLSEEQTQRQVLGHLLDRAFAGSAGKLVLQALAVKKASPEELAEIRKLLDSMEGAKR
jgi:predicted transcriptional regulator